ncbi:MAG: T9SS type A sorting domain-containing protein [Ignavibacteria bacterium]|nr:MAG: T9SS type A sorting domain-containing protein [Ignavibacteria bacterium]
MTGYLRSRDTINVSAGWNMIGSISDSILVSQIASIPGGLVTSQFFGYSGTYVVSSTVVPGSAYWVKVNQDGKLLLQTSAIVVPSKLIRIVPMEGQPPPLPDRELAQERFLPSTFRLDQNYPNPFNPATTIRYALSEESRVTLKVYNMFGQELKTLADGIESAGSKAVSFEASTFPTGVYFYLLQAGRFVDVKRMVLIR